MPEKSRSVLARMMILDYVKETTLVTDTHLHCSRVGFKFSGQSIAHPVYDRNEVY